jgi:predicted deacylase
VRDVSISIGEITAAKGQKKTGFLVAGELPTGTIDLPITILNGVRSGPTLLVTAGVHGCEYPGMRAAQIIASETNLSALSGALVVVHNVNVPGFWQQVAFLNPFDGLNINRIWPGSLQPGPFYGPGTISHHIANTVFEMVQKKASHYMDMHGGDLPEDVPHFSASVMSGDRKVDDVSRGMLKYTLAEFVREGSPSPGHTTTSASELKLPNVLHEAGRAGLLEKDALQRHVSAIRNVMKYLAMMEGRPEEPSKQTKLGSKSIGVRAKRGGFFESQVKPGDIVSAGQVIGRIYSVFGETLEEVKAPMSGLILIVNFRAPKCVGDPLFSIEEVIR